MRHGTVYAYNYHKCRCPDCREAGKRSRKKQRESRLQRTADNGGIAPAPKHGLTTATNWGCKCGVCVAAKAEKNQTTAAKGYNARTQKKSYNDSLEGASQSGSGWTNADLEVATSPDLSAREAAKMLNRTTYAVNAVRYRLNKATKRDT